MEMKWVRRWDRTSLNSCLQVTSCILYKFQIRLEGLSGLVPVHLDTSSDSVSGYAISE